MRLNLLGGQPESEHSNYFKVYYITFETKYSQIMFEVNVSKKNGHLSKIANSIVELVVENKKLFTDGNSRPNYTKLKIRIKDNSQVSFSRDVNFSNDKATFFALIAWELRNDFPADFKGIFSIPKKEIGTFNKKEHFKYVKNWISKKKGTWDTQKTVPIKPHPPRKEPRKPWVNIISTPMRN
jgi:hypothetical protein